MDAWLNRYIPIPTQVISNEEYVPIAQAALQNRPERTILQEAERHSKRLGISRREFLRSTGGTAVAFAAMNTVFGGMFRVEAAELFDTSPVTAKPHNFIFDVQTHHVATPNQAPHADEQFLEMVVGMRGDARSMDPALKDRAPRIEDAYVNNYIKEVFLDSQTDMVALSATVVSAVCQDRPGFYSRIARASSIRWLFRTLPYRRYASSWNSHPREEGQGRVVYAA